jgi:hypothetical protein
VHIKIAHEHHPLLQLRHKPPNTVVEIQRMVTKQTTKEGIGNPISFFKICKRRRQQLFQLNDNLISEVEIVGPKNMAK